MAARAIWAESVSVIGFAHIGFVLRVILKLIFNPFFLPWGGESNGVAPFSNAQIGTFCRNDTHRPLQTIDTAQFCKGMIRLMRSEFFISDFFHFLLLSTVFQDNEKTYMKISSTFQGVLGI